MKIRLPWGAGVEWEPDYLVITGSDGITVEFVAESLDAFIDAMLEVAKARSYSTEKPAR